MFLTKSTTEPNDSLNGGYSRVPNSSNTIGGGPLTSSNQISGTRNVYQYPTNSSAETIGNQYAGSGTYQGIQLSQLPPGTIIIPPANYQGGQQLAQFPPGTIIVGGGSSVQKNQHPYPTTIPSGSREIGPQNERPKFLNRTTSFIFVTLLTVTEFAISIPSAILYGPCVVIGCAAASFFRLLILRTISSSKIKAGTWTWHTPVLFIGLSIADLVFAIFSVLLFNGIEGCERGHEGSYYGNPDYLSETTACVDSASFTDTCYCYNSAISNCFSTKAYLFQANQKSSFACGPAVDAVPKLGKAIIAISTVNLVLALCVGCVVFDETVRSLNSSTANNNQGSLPGAPV